MPCTFCGRAAERFQSFGAENRAIEAPDRGLVRDEPIFYLRRPREAAWQTEAS